jgi:hypothetical protein
VTVHNHGTEEGEGLACPELRLPSGRLKGKCLLQEDVLRGDISINTFRRAMGMSESIQNDPLWCQDRAKAMVTDHITNRYSEIVEYTVYIDSFVQIGLTWRAVLRTTLPNSGVYVVQYYALEQKTTLKAYAMVEEISSYKG